MNLDDIFKKIENNELVLPDFQRNFVWSKDGQRALAASVLLNFPIGGFLILDGKKDDFATKKLGFSTEEASPTDECEFLLDGQQRLTSMKTIFSNPFNNDNWQENIKEMYKSLRTKWFLKIVPECDQEDIWGWSNLIFDEEILRNIEPTQLENMIIDKTVGITKGSQWWNPNYVCIGSNGEKIDKTQFKKYQLGIAKEMYKENLIPLSIYNEDEKVLLDYSLEYIANDRMKNLIAELELNLDKASEIFDQANINYVEIDRSNLEMYMFQLKEKWKFNISTYLKNILKNTDAEIIRLKSNEIGRAVIIFERINKGGTNLDNFDLVVARAARDKSEESLTKRIINYLEQDIELSDALTTDLKGHKPRTINLSDMQVVKNNEINSIVKNQYLNLLSLISNVEYGNVDKIRIELTKKEKILNIPYDKINKYNNNVLIALGRACQFLHVRCGIVTINELHYKLMLLPIAYSLLDDNVWNDKSKLGKIEYWYWCSIFAGEYRQYPNQMCIEDIRDLYRWVNMNQEVPRYSSLNSKIFNVKDFSDVDTLIKDNDSDLPIAIHKGILQYELSLQPNDLLYNEIRMNTWDIAKQKEITINNKKVKISVQDHHIIPLATSKSLLESTKSIRNNNSHYLNSILNRTYILGETNLIFSAIEPCKYLQQMEQKSANYMLNTHFIPDNYKEYLNSDYIGDKEKIKEFYKMRFEKIKTVMHNELDNLVN